MLAHTQEGLLAQFRAYLEAEGAENDIGENDAQEARVDLYALFGELAALKNEVRIESRQVKGALDQFRELVEPLRVGHEALQGELDRSRRDRRDIERETLRPLLLELLELRDRMANGLAMTSCDQSHKKFFKRWCRKEQELFGSWRSGQEMTLRRLDQILVARDVHPIEVVGRPLDPRMARAVQVEQRRGVADGWVVAELRKGFLWQGELLRVAEVVVNRVGL